MTIMTKYLQILFLLLCPLTLMSCNDDDGSQRQQPAKSNAATIMRKLWVTSPINDVAARMALYDSIQAYADGCSAAVFKQYLTTDNITAAAIDAALPAMACYNEAFEKVKREVQTAQVAEGSALIWLLYNMGYVVKTPTATFAVDLYHRRAAELEPLLDFACFTHEHQDHYSRALMEAMTRQGKPVLSNFYSPTGGYEYCSRLAKDYEIKGIKVHSFLTDHNNNLKNFVSVFQFDCGTAGGGLNIAHSGDSNFQPSQFRFNATPDVYILRYAVNALTENNIVGGVVSPKYVLLSHVLELSHDGVANSRWTLRMGLERAAAIDCQQTYMPFWGDRMTWDGNSLK